LNSSYLTRVSTGIAGAGQSKKGLTSNTIAFDATLNPGSAVNMGVLPHLKMLPSGER
jgi:hypothetical protein